MSVRRVLTTGLLTLAMPAAYLLMSSQSSALPEDTGASAVADTAPPATAAAKKKKKKPKGKKTTISVRVLPPIAHQGAKPAAAGKARVVFTGVVKPKKAQRKVAVLMKVGKKKWTVAGTARTAKQGGYTLTAPTRKGAKYRIRAAQAKGVRMGMSKVVTVDRWLKPTFGDDFNGTKLGDVWVHRGADPAYWYKAGYRACSRTDPSAAKVQGGTLRLSVLKDPNPPASQCKAYKGNTWTMQDYRLNANIGTEGTFAFRYGFAAARMKMQPARGQHSSFWMQPETYVPNGTPDVAGAEIDTIEYVGDGHPKGGLTTFIHWKRKVSSNPDVYEKVKTGDWVKNPQQYLAGKKDGWSKNYHVFSVEWTPQEYIFRIDGKVTWRTKVGISQVRQFPIISLMSSDYALAELNGKLPQHAYVDWLRVWELPRP
jgi:beta-glucanase (GH16 family)